MSGIRRFIRKLFPVHYFLHNRSYSQEGEDMVLRGFFEGQKNYKGFYVDVGAHHPFRFSNTMYFYRKGWRGINIEPTPTVMRLFRMFRRRDINLNLGISESRQQLTFYCFNEPALNGFSKAVSEERDQTNGYRIVNTLQIDTWPLAEVLDRYLPPGQQIDFLSVDAEGLDLAILRSNNWQKYKPRYILVEDAIDPEHPDDSETYRFLKGWGYTWVAKTGRTLFFKLQA